MCYKSYYQECWFAMALQVLYKRLAEQPKTAVRLGEFVLKVDENAQLSG
jgi:hypothetical protein